MNDLNDDTLNQLRVENVIVILQEGDMWIDISRGRYDEWAIEKQSKFVSNN